MLYSELSTPAVVADLDIVERNIEAMAARLRAAGLAHRPHIKTHKSIALARKQARAGAQGITAAKIGEAEVFAAAGFDDIFIAYPLVGEDKWRRFGALHRRIRVSASIDSEEVAAGLSRVGESAGKPVPVLIEIDGGLHRGGRQPGEDAVRFAVRASAYPGIRVEGVMGYFGTVYDLETASQQAEFAAAEGETMRRAAADLRAAGLAAERVSAGSTPSAQWAERLSGVTEVRAGNYIFYDISALRMGIARVEDCALRVVATVVSVPAAGRATIDAGSKTLSSDRARHADGFGCVVGHPGVAVSALNEEHGLLAFDPGAVRFRVGDRVEIIPNHACALPNLCDAIAGVRAGRAVETIRVDARGCSV